MVGSKVCVMANLMGSIASLPLVQLAANMPWEYVTPVMLSIMSSLWARALPSSLSQKSDPSVCTNPYNMYISWRISYHKEEAAYNE